MRQAMNETDALSRFVKENFRALTARELTQQDLKDLIRVFFRDKLGSRVSRPTPKQVIGGLLALLSGKGLSLSDLEEYVLNLPVFGFAGDTYREQCFDELQSQNLTSGVAKVHIDTIRQVGAFEAVVQTVGREVEAKKLQELSELNDEIARKR